MSDCLFCKIAEKKIPSKIAGEAADWVAFRDINPQAPTHVLIVPRRHVDSVKELDAATAGMLIEAAKTVAGGEGLSSYRLVFNCGSEAGQSVWHVHLHLLGGRAMHWPPG